MFYTRWNQSTKSSQELVPTVSFCEVCSKQNHSSDKRLKLFGPRNDVCLGFRDKEAMRILVFMSESLLLTGKEAPPRGVCLPFWINSPNICFKSRVVLTLHPVYLQIHMMLQDCPPACKQTHIRTEHTRTHTLTHFLYKCAKSLALADPGYILPANIPIYAS